MINPTGLHPPLHVEFHTLSYITAKVMKNAYDLTYSSPHLR